MYHCDCDCRNCCGITFNSASSESHFLRFGDVFSHSAFKSRCNATTLSIPSFLSTKSQYATVRLCFNRFAFVCAAAAAEPLSLSFSLFGPLYGTTQSRLHILTTIKVIVCDCHYGVAIDAQRQANNIYVHIFLMCIAV